MLARFLLVTSLLLAPAAADPLSDTSPDTPSGGKVEWARLKTASPTWARHIQSDPYLLRFIRTSTTLNIDTVWRVADVENLQQMCAYPFLFSEGLHHITDPQGLDNLREYIKRGGFVFVDSCTNPAVNPDPNDYLAMQIKTLQTIFPDARIERVPDDNEIFHNCFDMKDGLPHTYWGNNYDPAWAKFGLYAVYSGGRLISLISLCGLQCGWSAMDRDPDHIANCMKMVVNIYIYAITH
jgi:hypothetical protein